MPGLAALVAGLGLLLAPASAGAAIPNPPLPCDDAVETAVALALEGDLEGAGRLLEGALLRCPEHVGVLRELAAVRFREGRHADAEALAHRLLALEPSLAWGWDLLGTLRYLDDDAVGALRAWNRISRPRLSAVEILGPAGVPPASVTGLRPGSLVTPAELARARRRLEALPGVGRARVHYRPLPGGEVQVQANVTRHAPHTLTRGSLPAHLARAVGGGVRIEATDRAGRGERVVLSGLLDRDHREARLSVAHPAPRGWAPAVEWTLRHQVTEWDGFRTERTGGRATLVPWPRARASGTIGVGGDHWPAFGTHGVLEGAARLDLGRVFALHVDGSWWTGNLGRTEVALETTMNRHTLPGAREDVGGRTDDPFVPGPALRARTALTALHGVTSGDAPDDLAPRYGGRRSATHPMRATGRMLPPGDAWMHGTVEVSRGWSTAIGVVVGGAVFADGVRGIGGPDGLSDRGSVHVGVGLRLGIPGADGRLMADWAVDPARGRSRASITWAGRGG